MCRKDEKTMGKTKKNQDFLALSNYFTNFVVNKKPY